eukprot:5083210-Prymnesium_polylepis.1
MVALTVRHSALPHSASEYGACPSAQPHRSRAAARQPSGSAGSTRSAHARAAAGSGAAARRVPFGSRRMRTAAA